MKSEKQSAAARENGKKGGRPRTGIEPQIHITFPAWWVERLDSVLPPGEKRSRWIREHLESFLEVPKD